MDSWAIRNGWVLDPANSISLPHGTVLVKSGRVEAVGDDLAVPADYKVHDACGLLVCPGFIDLHTHLREPGAEHKETIASGTMAAAAGGFSTVCAMPNTVPVPDSVVNLELCRAIGVNSGKVRILYYGALSVNRSGKRLADLTALARAGAIGFSDDGDGLQSEALLCEALELVAQTGGFIANHAEVAQLVGDGVANPGAVAERLGFSARPIEAEQTMVRRDIGCAQRTGASIHIPHVSAAPTVREIRMAKAHGVKVTAEVTPHHLLLNETSLLASDPCDPNLRVNPPIRSEDDRLELLKALDEGILDAVATDHAPHEAKSKLVGFERAAPGISGLETACAVLTTLSARGELRLEVAIERLTAGPASVLGRTDIGNLSPGSHADITVIDPAKRWRVNPVRFLSKGRNTPLAGRELTGKVRATMYAGSWVFTDE